MSDMNMAPDAGQPPDQDADQGDDSNIVSVEIQLNTQTGQFSVGIENEAAEGQGDDDSNMQPARSIDDALRMAKDLLESGGQSSPETDQAFQSGYSNVRGGGQ